jgi:hypothetical protein
MSSTVRAWRVSRLPVCCRNTRSFPTGCLEANAFCRIFRSCTTTKSRGIRPNIFGLSLVESQTTTVLTTPSFATSRSWIADMTPQEILDAVARHLFAQGYPARDGHKCYYRTHDGEAKCAVGVLIPDELYRSEMEHYGVLQLIERYEVPSWFHGHVMLLSDLQRVHDTIGDTWHSTLKMRTHLTWVANKHGLSTETIDTLSFADR